MWVRFPPGTPFLISLRLTAMKISLLLGGICSALFCCMPVLLSAVPEKPNIVLIYADDLGMGMLGCYGQKIVKTPHVDKLARQGMLFTNAHSSQYCCPARASLLMGVHDSHRNSYTEIHGGLVMKKDKEGWTYDEYREQAEKLRKVAPSEQEVFLPQMLREAGYVTGQFGKLDWGFTTWHEELQRHGWDHYAGYYDHQRAHGFYPRYLWKDGRELPLDGNTRLDAGVTIENYQEGATEKRRDRTGKHTYAPDVMLSETLSFMEKNRDKPFFVFFSTNLPHGPVDVPSRDLAYEGNPSIVKAYKDAKGNNTECASAAMEYASMVKKLDDQVGAIVSKISQLNLQKKTVIIFTSDNGHEIYYRTDKSRGRSLGYHGGVEDESGRILDVFRGNASTVNGKQTDFAGLKWTNWEGGIRVPMIVCWPGIINSGSCSNQLIANYDHMASFADLAGIPQPKGKDARSYKDILLEKATRSSHEYIIVDKAIITCDGWKLTNKKGWYLFHLAKDMEERNNLADANPEKLQELKKIYDKEVNSPRADKLLE